MSVNAIPTPGSFPLSFGERDAKIIETATLAAGTLSHKTIDSTNSIGAVTLTAAKLTDASKIVGTADATKVVAFSNAGMTTGKTLTVGFITDASNGIKFDLTGVTAAAATTIKASNTAAAVITLPNATSTVATLGLAESFTGVKTFSVAPVIATITNGAATLTLPTVTGTIAKTSDIGTDVRATATVSLSQADIVALYATPKQLVAGSTGQTIIVEAVEVLHSYSTTQYAGGGVCKVQYDSTVNGAGTPISADLASVVGAAATTNTFYAIANTSGVDEAATAGKGIYLSNASGVFTGGNVANVLKVRVSYRVVTTLV